MDEQQNNMPNDNETVGGQMQNGEYKQPYQQPVQPEYPQQSFQQAYQQPQQPYYQQPMQQPYQQPYQQQYGQQAYPQYGNENSYKADPQKAYIKYKGDFEKSNLFSIISNIIAIVGVLFLILAPVFRINLSLEGLVIETKDFSLLDELFLNIEGIKSASNETAMVGYLMIMMPALSILMGVITLILCIKNLLDEISNRNDNAYMIKYAQIKKSGGEHEKKKFFQQQNLYAFFIYIVFDVAFAKLIGAMISKIPETIGLYSYLLYVNGVATFGYFGIGLVIAAIIVSAVKKNIDKNVMVNVLKDDFDGNNKNNFGRV